VGGSRNPEQFHFVVFGETLDFDELAIRPFMGGPGQGIDPAIGLLSTGIVDLAIVLEWAVVNLVERIDEQYQFLGGIPGIHQDGMKRQLLVPLNLREHVLHVVELTLAVPVRVIDAIIDYPILAALGIDIHAVDQADALNQTVRIAGILQPHQLDLV